MKVYKASNNQFHTSCFFVKQARVNLLTQREETWGKIMR